MEADVAVAEPDVGTVKNGQPVVFTVPAYLNRTFNGNVFELRQNHATVSNVVTYAAEIFVPNLDGAMRPGMTTNDSIHVAKMQSAFVAPLQALTYSPHEAQKDANAAANNASARSEGKHFRRRDHFERGARGCVFILPDGKSRRLA